MKILTKKLDFFFGLFISENSPPNCINIQFHELDVVPMLVSIYSPYRVPHTKLHHLKSILITLTFFFLPLYAPYRPINVLYVLIAFRLTLLFGSLHSDELLSPLIWFPKKTLRSNLLQTSNTPTHYIFITLIDLKQHARYD